MFAGRLLVLNFLSCASRNIFLDSFTCIGFVGFNPSGTFVFLFLCSAPIAFFQFTELLEKLKEVVDMEEVSFDDFMSLN